MSRGPRILVRGYAHHIVQRGHNKNAVFVEDRDYEFYLANLIEWKAHYNVGVYGFCLMTNHVHLILEPYVDGSDISGLMRRLSAKQTRFVNRLEGRIGTQWAGRFKSSVIDTDKYLLACLRYVDLNPVRAGLVKHPGQYRWSSYSHRFDFGHTNFLDPDPVTELLGSTPASRRCKYAKFVAGGNPDKELGIIRAAVGRNQLTGDKRFIDEISDRTGIRIERRGPGRPKRSSRSLKK